MMKRCFAGESTGIVAFTISVALLFVFAPSVSAQHRQVADFMPQSEDYTSMWWVDGFPGTIDQASWRRCIQTGHYAFVLDTQTLAIDHLGPISTGTDYATSDRVDDSVWNSLPPAKLSLSIRLGDKVYRYSGGGKWSRFAGPRLIAAGRFVQRADITGLTFADNDGNQLDAEARLETIAWANRLTLILAIRPTTDETKPSDDPPARKSAAIRHPGQQWDTSSIEIAIDSERGQLKKRNDFALGKASDSVRPKDGWLHVGLAFDPVSWTIPPRANHLTVTARALQRRPGSVKAFDSESECPVSYDSLQDWHRIDLNGVKPILPLRQRDAPLEGVDRLAIRNDSLERIKLRLTNRSEVPQLARLVFAKTAGGFRQNLGSSITGIVATLRDPDGDPTGIPVQLSKNWHTKRDGGVHSGSWFDGFCQLRMPRRSTVDLELTINYGHWGGVPAASHAQLCLIGWGSNQHWTQSAIGAWGESICYEPDQQQANCTITDVRPVMVTDGPSKPHWQWTGNVGGGDFFRCFDSDGKRVPHRAMRTIYHRQGPCMTEVTFAGKLGQGIDHRSTVTLTRSDDLVRATYRIRMDVNKPTDFSRFVFFQIGADTYSYTRERKIAIGNDAGLIKQWNAQWGGDRYRTQPMAMNGRSAWVSLHEADRPPWTKPMAWANRGIVVRHWKAQVGGKPTQALMAERGLRRGRIESSTVDFVPPQGVTRFQKGDFVEATFQHIVMPQHAADYYGPNTDLRKALQQHEDSWQMIHREATLNERIVVMTKGDLQHRYPDLRIATANDQAELNVQGGLGYVPITFNGLSSHESYQLYVDDQMVDQSVHGKDFWQTDYDPTTRTWSHTYNIKLDSDQHKVRFIKR